jgi:hypothetical protein
MPAGQLPPCIADHRSVANRITSVAHSVVPAFCIAPYFGTRCAALVPMERPWAEVAICRCMVDRHWLRQLRLLCSYHFVRTCQSAHAYHHADINTHETGYHPRLQCGEVLCRTQELRPSSKAPLQITHPTLIKSANTAPPALQASPCALSTCTESMHVSPPIFAKLQPYNITFPTSRPLKRSSRPPHMPAPLPFLTQQSSTPHLQTFA